MTWQNIAVVNVYYVTYAEKLHMGRLALKNRQIFFEYSSDFLKSGLELSPIKLPLKPGVILCDDRSFDGLFGVFNDSLPDGWGRLLLDRKLMQLGINPNELSPLDRLCYVGNCGMGALAYEPEINSTIFTNHKELDEIADETLKFQNDNGDQFVDELLNLNGFSAGARPKILVNIDAADWIIKFRSSLDPKDIGPIEYAYYLMAKAAQLEVPDTKLFPSKKTPGYFGSKRFDRMNSRRIHVHTVSGLLHADHRIPSLDYKMLMQATFWLTKDIRECEKQFSVAAFNVFTHNRDDHAKNFSFLMGENNTWRVAPAYDLTFSAGPAGEHCTTIMAEGKNPGKEHLLKLAEAVGIKKQTALQIIDNVKYVATNWESFAKTAGVSNSSTAMIKSAINQVIRSSS